MATTGMIAAVAADGGDPRLPATIAPTDAGPHTNAGRLLHDPSVTFEEYRYFAERTRAEETEALKIESPSVGIWQTIFPTKSDSGVTLKTANATRSSSDNEKKDGQSDAVSQPHRLTITDVEWTNASRAIRTASSAACFYLITTDILGPFGIGFSLGTLGWGPGIALFTVFGLMAGYSGWLLWTCFLGLDSYEYPCKNYADLAFRTYGRPARYVVNFLQSVQLILSVGNIIISNGQALSQVSKFKLCYVVCCLIWAICGFGLGQIRTLQKFGILANFAVFINLLIMFITMGVMAHSPPNYAISTLGSAGFLVDQASIKPVDGVYPPIIHYAGLPDPNSIIGSINGLMQGVYAYAGAQLFVEFMAEMKRPRDFLKAMWGAQFFIYTVYMVYGCYVYYWQGQYSYQFSYQGVSIYGWQVVGNMLAIISGLIAATLYGNIGIKVLYNNIFIDFFNAPSLLTKKGKMLWAVLVPFYWILCFIIAGSIPYFSGLVSVTAAFCFVQFTYSFPPIIAFGYLIQRNAMQPGEGFDPATGQVVYHDTGIKRWVRGFFAKEWYINAWNIIYAMGALSVSGLGAYAACEALIEAFAIPEINAFSCQSPLNLTPQ